MFKEVENARDHLEENGCRDYFRGWYPEKKVGA